MKMEDMKTVKPKHLNCPQWLAAVQVKPLPLRVSKWDVSHKTHFRFVCIMLMYVQVVF